MRKLICAIAASVCLVSAGAAFAGDGHKRHAGQWHGKKGMHLLEQKLDLSEEQKLQIQAIRQAAKEDRQDRPGKGMNGLMALDPGAADYHMQVQTLAEESARKLEQSIIARGNARAEIFAILTEEQRQELKAMQEKMQERRQQRVSKGSE